MTIKDLQPALLFDIFDQINQVPRPSKKEEKIRQFLLDFAAKHGIEAKTDAIGNVAMRIPATPGCEDAPTVVLQGHMDMVCESNDKSFDFENNPIKTIVEGEWVRADGTTLGADNGIGVAAGLAVCVDKTLVHGPVECLFTVDEETGLTGANNLGEGMITGSMLVNLDSEDDAEVFVGCAGGVDTTCEFHFEPVATPAGLHFLKLDVANGLGGHSGCDIHLGRANANRLVARFLWAQQQKHELALAEILGGNLRNAIPRAAHAIFGVKAEDKDQIVAEFNQYVADVKAEFAGVEDAMTLTLTTADAPATCIDPTTARNLIAALYAAPNGVIGMSRDLEGLVETSTNLASIKLLPDNVILVTTSQRSSVESCKWDIARRIEAIFALAGAKVTHGDGYPGWKPDMNSRLLQLASDAYEELYGIRPAVKAIHAGLECGLFKLNHPHLDMVSFGPTLQGVHSPSERMHIPAVQRFWGQLTLLLEKISKL